jgi:DNA processing protein
MNAKDILTLLNTPSVGRRTVQTILNRYSHNISSHYELLDVLKEMSLENPRIVLPTAEQLLSLYNEAERLIDLSREKNVETLDFRHPKFPKRFLDIPDAPVLIYAKGNIEALNSERSIAIIGTREPTDFGIRAGERLAAIFSKSNFIVVSGLAIGCDAAAHRGCLKEKGITIAVMAGGLDRIYPKENKELAENILDNNGCFISEYPVGTTPRGNYFVERDRLQSGLSQGVIVIETDIKGGTMHTVGFSIKQKRLLACLNGHPDQYLNNPKIQGNKMLIREGKAKKLGTSEEIDEFISMLVRTEVIPIPTLVHDNRSEPENKPTVKRKPSKKKAKKGIENPQQTLAF